MDYVLLAFENKLQHEDHLGAIIVERFSKFGLILNINKYILGVEQIDFLGYSVNNSGTKRLQQKIQAIIEYKNPYAVNEL